MVDIDLLKPQELMPKDILRFVEQKAERAIEILREIIEIPEYADVSNGQLQAMMAQAQPNQFIGGLARTTAGTGFWNTATTPMVTTIGGNTLG